MTRTDLHATSRSSRVHRAARWVAAGAAGTLVAATLVLAGSGSAAIAGARDEGNLSVDVTDGFEPSPSPTRTTGPAVSTPSAPPMPSSPPPGPGSSQSSPVTAQVTQPTITDPASADAALGDEAGSDDGVLAMSGLSAESAPSFGIDNGTLTLSFVVRNNTPDPVNASAKFWVDNAFGLRLADVADVKVENLEPDETRRVLVRIDGLGQHVLLRNYVELTSQVEEGADPVTMTRDVTLAVPPLFSVSLAGAIGALSGLGWWALRARRFGFGLGLGRLSI